MNMHLTVAATVIVLAFAGSAQAKTDEREKVEILYETTLNLIHLLVEQGVIKQEMADEMIRKAEQKAKAAQQIQQAQEKALPPAAGEPKKGEVRVTYVPEHIKKEIRDQLREEVIGHAKGDGWQEVSVAPEWTNRFKMEGDIRLREQADFYPKTNAPAANFQANGQLIDNTTEDSLHRERIRMRLGVNTNVTRGVDLGLRLTTGNINDPVTTGRVLRPPSDIHWIPGIHPADAGNLQQQIRLVLDQVYLRLTPWDWLTVSGGRFPNPFFIGTVGNIYTGILRPGHTIPTAGVQHTDLLWDTDLNFEGMAINLHPWIKENRTVKPFLNAGIFPLQKINQSETVKAKDKWFYGVQAGIEWSPEDTDTKVRVGSSLLRFPQYRRSPQPHFGDTLFNQTATLFRQKGNSLFNIDNDGDPTTNLWALAADYKIANRPWWPTTPRFKPIHVIGTVDYVRNVGYNQNKILTPHRAKHQTGNRCAIKSALLSAIPSFRNGTNGRFSDFIATRSGTRCWTRSQIPITSWAAPTTRATHSMPCTA